MKTDEILKEIERLPLKKRIFLIEKALQSIRKKEDLDEIQIAAEALCLDYKNDKELTSFSDIDFDDFYETK
jgi:hypothetical protein